MFEYTGSLGKKKEEPKEVNTQRPPTVNEMKVRLKFGLATHFLSKANSLIKIGYRKAVKGYASEMNIAVKHTINNAITGDFPNFSIDYCKFALTHAKQDIDYAGDPYTFLSAGCIVQIYWRNTPYPLRYTSPSDPLMIFLYCEKTDQGIIVERAAKRGDLKHTLHMQPEFAGSSWHIWMFFMSDNEKLVAKSHYLGEVTLIG